MSYHNLRQCLTLACLLLLTACSSSTLRPTGKGLAGAYDVRAYGAIGDGKTLDTAAVNHAIDAANADGGGTVHFPSGVYLCHSIHLKSNVSLYLHPGCTLMAAPPAPEGTSGPTYDLPEPNPSVHYQDFGHTHWHNSFIWGENLQNVSIIGPGLIDGSKGLTRGSVNDKFLNNPGNGMGAGEFQTFWSASAPSSGPTSRKTRERKPRSEFQYPDKKDTVRAGVGNKAIALKLCRNVILKDFSILAGGHFGILATGTDNLTIDNLKIDTNRDGMDIDCCQNVRVSNCFVNSPYDDGICPKSSYALGYARSTDNVTITNCQVSSYVAGSLLDGTCKPFWGKYAKAPGGTGRIKCGTESNGGFRNLTITNCVFDYCRGLALETVDGALLEDVTVSNITMRHICSSPIFMRLGARLRGPKESTHIGALQRINIDNVVVYDADPHYSTIISGVPDADIRDVKLSNIQIFTRGGELEKTKKWATTQALEYPRKYPEPSMFGETAAYGFFVRHVAGIEFNNVSVHHAGDDARSPCVFNDVKDLKLIDVDVQHDEGVPPFVLRNVKNVMAHLCAGVEDTKQESVENGKLGAGELPEWEQKKSEPGEDDVFDDTDMPATAPAK